MNIPTVYAADGVDISKLYNPATKITDFSNLGAILPQSLLNILFVLVGVFFFIGVVNSGWDYMLSTGDPKKVSAASLRFTNSFIGLVLTVGAYLVVRVVARVVGINF